MFCTNSELLYKPDYSRGTVLHGRRYLVILILNTVTVEVYSHEELC